jgi:hypothetical protein
MTRDQELERQLAAWLEAGPVVAPPAVVDRAIGQSRGRRQRYRLWRWLGWLPVRPEYGTRSWSRLAVLAAVVSGVLLISLSITVPFGGAGPAPEIEPDLVRAIAGSVRVTDETRSPTGLSRTVEVEVEDRRIDGRARQDLDVSFETADMHHYRGTMRLETAWGGWVGPVEISGYPGGEEVEMAWLAGTDAFEGFTYVYAIHSQPAETERTVAGAIWPDEPPAMPDPSLLP